MDANKWITVLYLWGQNMYKLKLREASEADETGSDANRVRLITLLSLTWPPPVTTITGTSQYIHLFWIKWSSNYPTVVTTIIGVMSVSLSFFISSIHPTNLPQTNYPKPVTAIIGVNLSINLSSYPVTTRVSKIQPKHYSTDTSAITMRNIVFLFCLDNCTLCTATAVVNNRVVGEELFLFNSSQPFTFREHYPFMGWVPLHKETKLKKLLQAIDKRWSCEPSFKLLMNMGTSDMWPEWSGCPGTWDVRHLGGGGGEVDHKVDKKVEEQVKSWGGGGRGGGGIPGRVPAAQPGVRPQLLGRRDHGGHGWLWAT